MLLFCVRYHCDCQVHNEDIIVGFIMKGTFWKCLGCVSLWYFHKYDSFHLISLYFRPS